MSLTQLESALTASAAREKGLSPTSPEVYVGDAKYPSAIFLAGHVVAANYSKHKGAYLSWRPILKAKTCDAVDAQQETK